jgi:hypothetical protein
MNVSLILDLAATIRRIDGDNTLDPHDLGRLLAEHEPLRRKVIDTELAAFVERTNPRKDVGAGALAELIVAEFELDGEG